MNQTITLTFSESVENHTGMQIIGTRRQSGISSEKCIELFDKYECAELYYLNKLIRGSCGATSPVSPTIESKAVASHEPPEDAYVLVLKNGLKHIFNIDHKEMYKEQLSLTPDKKAFMYGRVVNKKARYNLCYANEYQSPNYEEKRGTVIPFSQLPIMNEFRNKLHILGDEFKDLYAEGNFYYDINKCFIGYHGDTERKVVVGVRLNKEFPLHFKWFHKGKETDLKTTIELEGGDIYIMNEKATGNDWKMRSIEWTLRHAAGFNLN